MQTLLGIDLGTSSLKGMLLDIASRKVEVEKVKYKVQIPKAGYAEQNAEMWWSAFMEVLNKLKAHNPQGFDNICGISFSGQMHGLVAIDCHGNPVRSAIIWLDQRSDEMVKLINEKLTQSEIAEILHNRIHTGFAFPSLLWMKEYEPESYERIHKVMLPKDYLRYKITGRITTDITDASATAMFNIGKREWAWEIVQKFNVKKDIFPECNESTDIVGEVTEACSQLTGLKQGIPVVCGCGDQMAQSLGNGIFQQGKMISNIGTGGQISSYSNSDIYDKELRTHTFCNAINQGYSIFGATLSCGNSLNWLCNSILNASGIDFEECNKLAAEVPEGSDGIIYLPYLTGERTPIMNADAKGMLFGLTLKHDKRFIIRAVMEGIIYSLKDCLCLMEGLGLLTGDEMIASGGGASSELLLQMQADIFVKKIKVCTVREQACLGACILAGVGIGIFDVKTACDKYVTFHEEVYHPKSKTFEIYRAGYSKYHSLYNQTKYLM